MDGTTLALAAVGALYVARAVAARVRRTERDCIIEDLLETQWDKALS